MTTLPPNRDQSRADENVVLDTRGLCDLAHRAWGTLIPRRHRDLLESSGTPGAFFCLSRIGGGWWISLNKAITQARRINRSQRISVEHRSIDSRDRTVRLRERCWAHR